MRTTLVTGAGPFALAVLLGAAGCGPKSQIDGKSSVTLSGTVQAEGGAPSPSTKVKLIRHPDLLQTIGEAFVAIGSVGLACISGQLDICSSFEESQSGGDGSYSFAMRGADTQGSGGQALTFTNFATCPGGTCAVASDFQIQRTNLPLPALRFWAEVGAVAADSDGNSVVSWPALEAAVGGAAADGYKVSIVGGDGAIWWQQDAQRATSTVVDRRITQDKDTLWTVIASRKQASNVGTDFYFNWYATQQAYPNHQLTPLSRAADCYTQGPDGMPARLARPCPLTDGNPATKFVPVSAPPCPSGQMCTPPPVNNWMVIDIGFSHPLAFLVVYDVAANSATSMVLVETSDDLMTWTLQQTLKLQPFQTLPLAGSGRFLRLRLSDPNAQFTGSGNGELAVYAPF